MHRKQLEYKMFPYAMLVRQALLVKRQAYPIQKQLKYVCGKLSKLSVMSSKNSQVSF